MYYEINVALHGKHFFATAKHSISSTYDLDKVLPAICKAFPKEQGYEVTATRWDTVGYSVEVPSVF